MHNKYHDEYLHLIKMFDKYASYSDVFLDFYYQNKDAQDLVQVRRKYDLKNVAGSGDEVSRIMNLFKWLNSHIVHDGSQIYSGESNVIDVLKQVNEEGKSVNCRMVAIALCEVFLAMGFSSRVITCMPIGFDFKDCHVVNNVYSATLDKWIFLDASMGVYFKDQNGVMLSLEELRDAVVYNKEVIINEAYKQGRLIEKDYYLTYMTKNLFQFACYSNAEFNYESKAEEKKIYYLNPQNYFPYNREGQVAWHGSKIKEIYVDCAAEFWKKPVQK